MFDFIDTGFEQTDASFNAGPYIPDAGECLRCGQCVSNCPTFRLFQIDEETPRRRIRTLSKILVENQPVSAEERRRLDNCLQCLACEIACPSRMAFGQLFDRARAQLAVKAGWPAKLAFWLIAHKRWRKRLMPLLAGYLKSGLQKPLRSTGILKKLQLADAEALLGKPALSALADCYPAKTAKRGRVALFTGCIGEHFDRETLLAAIKLLNAIGYEVLAPAQQGCCGAIHQHNGQSAAPLIENNIRVFNALDIEAVIYTATGCGAMLSAYQNSDETAAELFRQRLYDINEFLLQHWPDDLPLKPSTLKVAVHEPCSQRNSLKNQQAVYALLEKIPGADITALADNPVCCGAGGSYLLTHAANAGQLRDLKQQAISAGAADTVVSGNFGCALFLNANGCKLVHPILVLARQLD